MSSKRNLHPVTKLQSEKCFHLPSKNILPRTQTSTQRKGINTLINTRRQKSPTTRNTCGSPALFSKSTKNIEMRLSPAPVHLKNLKTKELILGSPFASETGFGSSKEIKHQQPPSPHSIKEMNKLKEKMKLESEAREAFLRAIISGRTYEASPDLNRSKSLRQFLKSEFQSKYTTTYSDYFENPKRLTQRQKAVPIKQFQQPDSKKYQIAQINQEILPTKNGNISQKEQYYHNQTTNQKYHTEIINYYNNQNNRMIQNTIHEHNRNNILIQNDLSIQSHIEQLNEVGLNSNVNPTGRVEQIRYQYKPIIAPPSITNNHRINSFEQTNYDQPQYMLYKPNTNANYFQANIPIYSNPSLPTSFNIQNQMIHHNSPKSIFKNSFRSHKSISFVDLNSNNHGYTQDSQMTEHFEPGITQKINQYMQILYMFAANIPQFDDLLHQPNSISGIVGFYLYKRLLVQRIRLYRCLAGGSNFFQDIDFYEITNQQLQQFNTMNEGKLVIKHIGQQNIGVERNLKLLLDYLKKQIGKDFPKSNLNLHQNFEVQLRYYLRLEAQQLKNKVKLQNIPETTKMRLLQRLVFLFQSLFLISFFNGEFIKNYELFQDVHDPQIYIQQNQEMFIECINKKN